MTDRTHLTFGARALLMLAKDGMQDAIHDVMADPALREFHMATIERESPPRDDTRYEAWARLTAARAKQHRVNAEAERGRNREEWAQHTVRAEECDAIIANAAFVSATVEPRDVLEAAHELRLLGCEGENALEVMVDAARRIRQLRSDVPHGIDAIRAVVRDELRRHAPTVDGQAEGIKAAIGAELGRRDAMIVDRFTGEAEGIKSPKGAWSDSDSRMVVRLEDQVEHERSRRQHYQSEADSLRQEAARAPHVSHRWGLHKGQWWLVELLDGEPSAAFHQEHGRFAPTRDTFERWSDGDGPVATDRGNVD